jgi:hypothetical protein
MRGKQRSRVGLRVEGFALREPILSCHRECRSRGRHSDPRIHKASSPRFKMD